MRSPFLPFLLVTMIGATACVPEEPLDEGHFETITQEIKGGTVDRETAGVVGLALSSGGLCSGTLIAPNLVLTAQHCVASISSGEGIRCGRSTFGTTTIASGVYVTTGNAISDRDIYAAYQRRTPDGYYNVQQIFTGEKDDVCSNDIALLLLAKNVPASEATPIVPRIDIPVYQGERYTAKGFGDDGTGRGSGLRRTLANRQVYCEGDDCYRVAGERLPSEFLGSDGTCQGDSGGPAIDAKGRVLGALSRGPDGCIASIYTGLPEWGEWIMEHGMLAADKGGYEPPFWAVHGVSEVPEADPDFDGVYTGTDNCEDVANPDQSDADGDGLGDACDEHSDADTIPDVDDNCPIDDNEDQLDTDEDGFGDACDTDDDGDGVEDNADFCPTNPKFTDYGSDCTIFGDDLIIVTAQDKGCSTASGGADNLAGLFVVLGLALRRRRSR